MRPKSGLTSPRSQRNQLSTADAAPLYQTAEQRIKTAPLYQSAEIREFFYPTSRVHPLASDALDLKQLIALWSQLRVGHPEAALAYYNLTQIQPLKYSQYVNDLQRAVDLQQRFNFSFHRIKLARETMFRQCCDPSVLQLLVVEFKTHLLNLVNLTLQARAFTHRRVYLPYFTLQSNLFKDIQHLIPNATQMAELLTRTNFCVVTNPRDMIARYLLAAKARQIQPDIACLHLLIGLDFGVENLAQRLAKFLDQTVEQRYDILSRKFTPSKVFQFLITEFSLSQTALDSFEVVKVPTFGTQTKPFLPKAPGYFPFINQRQELTPSSLYQKMIYQKPLSIGSAEEFQKNKISEQIDWLKVFYNVLDLNEFQEPQGALQDAMARDVDRPKTRLLSSMATDLTRLSPKSPLCRSVVLQKVDLKKFSVPHRPKAVMTYLGSRQFVDIKMDTAKFRVPEPKADDTARKSQRTKQRTRSRSKQPRSDSSDHVDNPDVISTGLAQQDQVQQDIATVASPSSILQIDKSKSGDIMSKSKFAEEAEQKRLAEEAEQKRLAEEAEQKRLAEEAEQKRLAEEAEAEARYKELQRADEDEKKKREKSAALIIQEEDDTESSATSSETTKPSVFKQYSSQPIQRYTKVYEVPHKIEYQAVELGEQPSDDPINPFEQESIQIALANRPGLTGASSSLYRQNIKHKRRIRKQIAPQPAEQPAFIIQDDADEDDEFERQLQRFEGKSEPKQSVPQQSQQKARPEATKHRKRVEK